MGTLREADRERLNNGGMLDDAVLFLFDKDSYDDSFLPDFFNDLAVVDFILGSLGGDGSMIDFGFLKNEMMKNDDMRFVCVWVLKKNQLRNTI